MRVAGMREREREREKENMCSWERESDIKERGSASRVSVTKKNRDSRNRDILNDMATPASNGE